MDTEAIETIEASMKAMARLNKAMANLVAAVLREDHYQAFTRDRCECLEKALNNALEDTPDWAVQARSILRGTQS